jgi:hypothetical protein
LWNHRPTSIHELNQRVSELRFFYSFSQLDMSRTSHFWSWSRSRWEKKFHPGLGPGEKKILVPVPAGKSFRSQSRSLQKQILVPVPVKNILVTVPVQKNILVPVLFRKNFGAGPVPVPVKKRNLVPVPVPIPPGPGTLCPSLLSTLTIHISSLRDRKMFS